MKEEELKKILEKHLKWLKDEVGGERADLYNADLRYVKLRYDNLSNANLYTADLCYANLSNAKLYKVGEIVEVKDFCEDRWKECSQGIHFYK